MLECASIEPRVSTGIDALDVALGGLYWGDNVVWELDGGTLRPFYEAIAAIPGTFDTRTFVAFGDGERAPEEAFDTSGLSVITAGPNASLASPVQLLHQIHRLCQPRRRRLLLFDSLDRMARLWGASETRAFFARCCPLLLEVGAIAYWSMSARHTPPQVRETVAAVTQCVLRVDERTVRIAKAEGRSEEARGSILQWHEEHGALVLAPAELVGRVATSLRTVRRMRQLSQHELAELAGVTASAISQAERAERGLSLATLLRLSTALGVTIDELLRGGDREAYRIGRRAADPQSEPPRSLTLLEGGKPDIQIDLVHLGAYEIGAPSRRPPGFAIIAVASGLVQVEIAGRAPALRHGEVLVSDSDRPRRWRNLGQATAMLFWIVIGEDAPQALRARRPAD
jgi:transcriptional regulator with XRE-family HTH domain